MKPHWLFSETPCTCDLDPLIGFPPEASQSWLASGFGTVPAWIHFLIMLPLNYS